MGNLQFTAYSIGVYGIAVILGGDVDSAGIQVTDRVVAAAVPELQLEVEALASPSARNDIGVFEGGEVREDE